MIRCENIYKTYKDSNALEDITLTLEKDKIYGLIGRNGAGKTTLLRIISNHIFPSGGKVFIDDGNILETPHAREKVCLVREKEPLFEGMRVKTIFKDAASCYSNWDQNYADKLIEKFNLPLKTFYKKLSEGMKCMVGIVIGLASRAPLTVFDESYVGMDAVNRQLFYDELNQDYMDNPRTFILSTHFMDEVCNLFEDVIYLHDGKVLLHEPLEIIREKSLYIRGEITKLHSLLSNKKIINENIIGDFCVASIYDDIDESLKHKLMDEGLEISQMPFQKWFVDMSKSLDRKSS